VAHLSGKNRARHAERRRTAIRTPRSHRDELVAHKRDLNSFSAPPFSILLNGGDNTPRTGFGMKGSPMSNVTEWQIETTLLQNYAPAYSPNRAEAVERVMRMIRERFILREEVEATIERLRFPDVEISEATACPLERSLGAYNKALDSVRVSLISNVSAPPARQN
jgi:hypothetical protein